MKDITVVDLFCGCGGFSLGFEEEGYKTLLANDIDINCAKTYQTNLPTIKFLLKDILLINNIELKKIFSHNTPNIIIGGPPCQGFSLANKHRHKENDKRNNLVYEFIRVVDCLNPEIFLMENVPGMLSIKNNEFIIYVKNLFEQSGSKYNVALFLINTAQFGVPQIRKRVFIMGVREDLKSPPTFPNPILDNEEKFISVWEALSDLPYIESGEGEHFYQYSNCVLSKYQKIMRKDSKGVYNHIAMVHTKRLIERFKNIKYGQSVKDVDVKYSAVQRGSPQNKSGKIYSQNNQRVYPNKPAPTIAASFQSNFIHPFLNRNFTAREGARLQSFPDRFLFEGKRTKMSWEIGLSQYQQIGNSVPPLLSKIIAKHLKSYF